MAPSQGFVGIQMGMFLCSVSSRFCLSFGGVMEGRHTGVVRGGRMREPQGSAFSMGVSLGPQEKVYV